MSRNCMVFLSFCELAWSAILWSQKFDSTKWRVVLVHKQKPWFHYQQYSVILVIIITMKQYNMYVKTRVCMWSSSLSIFSGDSEKNQSLVSETTRHFDLFYPDMHTDHTVPKSCYFITLSTHFTIPLPKAWAQLFVNHSKCTLNINTLSLNERNLKAAKLARISVHCLSDWLFAYKCWLGE